MSTLTLDLFLDAPPAVSIADPHDGGERDAHGEEPRREAPPAAAGRGRGAAGELILRAWGEPTPPHPAARSAWGGGGGPRRRPRAPAPRGGAMRPRYGSGAAPVGGRCGGCGSTLG